MNESSPTPSPDFQCWLETLLAELVSIRADAEHLEGIVEVQEILKRELQLLGFETTDSGKGIHLTASLATDRPHLAWVAHADTVVLPGSQCSLETVGTLLKGHGVADCRGGCVVLLGALRLLRDMGILGTKMGAYVISCGDEEIGSPTGRRLFEEVEGVEGALVFEPARPDGSVVVGRKGQMVIEVDFHGIPAHAGNDASAGASAVSALGQFVCDVDALGDSLPEATLNIGLIEGGGAFNVVAERARAVLDVRYWDTEDQSTILGFLEGWQAADSRVSSDTTMVVDRPAWRPDPDLELLTHYRAAAKASARTLSTMSVGGGSDANWLAARGIPVLDGLGPKGGGYHSHGEFAERDSLGYRAHIAAETAIRALAGHLQAQQ